MARMQAVSASTMKPLYGEMVTRAHELCLSLIGQAQAGNENGVRTEAERLMAQVGALVDLLTMKGDK